MKKILLFFIILMLSGCESTLFAGADIRGYLNSSAENSMFDSIYGMELDKEGNLYVADGYNNVIRKITLNGIVSTFAGTGKKGDKLGKKEEAEFNFPTSVKFDNNENLFITDMLNNKIKKVDKNGMVSVLDFQENSKIINPGNIYFSKDKFFLSCERLYEVLPGLKLNEITNEIPYSSLVGINPITSELYFLSVETIPKGFFFIPTGPDAYVYLYVRKVDGKYEDITKKYTKNPYPNFDPIAVIFDDEGNMYISYTDGSISKTSKEGKYIKTYSTSHFQFLPFSSTPLRIGKDKAYLTIVDNKRKILYYSNDYSIYKISIK